MKAKSFFTMSLYETLAVGFLSFISMHVYQLSVNNAVHKVEFIQVQERMHELEAWRKSVPFPLPNAGTIPKVSLAPDRRKFHIKYWI